MCRVYDKYQKKQVCFIADREKDANNQAKLYQLTLRPRYVADMTFEEAAKAYIDGKCNILSPTTVKDYRTTLRLHVEALKPIRLEDITSSVLQAHVNNLALHLAPKTVKNIYGFISVVLNSQMPEKVFKVSLPRKVKKELQMPSEEDISVLLSAVKNTDMEVPVKLAVFCCLRRGEIAGLLRHPECVKADSITVRYNVVLSGDDWVEKQPKTWSSYRTIPCPPDLAKMIKKAPRLNPAQISNGWTTLKRRYGIPFRFHDLRHFSASAMMTVMPIVDVEKFGGWRHGSSVLQDVYTYNIEESLRKSGSAWQEKVRSLGK